MSTVYYSSLRKPTTYQNTTPSPRSRNAITIKVKAGTLVLLHHSLVHYSHANSSEKSRHAYSIHVVEGEEGYRYPSDNWLQRPKDAPFQKLP